jgi:hypothetical protein
MTKTKMKKIDYSAGGDTCITRLPRDKKIIIIIITWYMVI